MSMGWQLFFKAWREMAVQNILQQKQECRPRRLPGGEREESLEKGGSPCLEGQATSLGQFPSHSHWWQRNEQHVFPDASIGNGESCEETALAMTRPNNAVSKASTS